MKLVADNPAAPWNVRVPVSFGPFYFSTTESIGIRPGADFDHYGLVAPGNAVEYRPQLSEPGKWPRHIDAATLNRPRGRRSLSEAQSAIRPGHVIRE